MITWSENRALAVTSVVILSLVTLASVVAARPTAFATVRRTIMATGAAMPKLPSDVVKYSQVPKSGSFTATTIPKGLLKDHTTKKGTWGIIRVDKGSLEYTIVDPAISVFELKAPDRGIIEPTRLHHVRALSDDLEFVVEFYRVPGTGPVDEKREGL